MVKIELQPEQIKDVIEKYKSNYKKQKIYVIYIMSEGKLFINTPKE